MGVGLRVASVALLSLTLGVAIGWLLRGDGVRAASGDWFMAPTTTPGILFYRYNGGGEIQSCVSNIDTIECHRLTIVVKDK